MKNKIISYLLGAASLGLFVALTVSAAPLTPPTGGDTGIGTTTSANLHE